MIIRHRQVLLPVLLWVMLCSGIFFVALVQQGLGVEWVPFLDLTNSFGWVGSLILAYLVLIWPMSLERMVERFARGAANQDNTYWIMAIQEPGLLILYGMPALVVTGAFADKSVVAIVQFVILLVAVGGAIMAHFSLGFFVHGNLARPYYALCGGLFLLLPLVNIVFEAFYSKGPRFLSVMNPFATIFALSSPSGVGMFEFLLPVIVFGATGLILFAFPILSALPPRYYDDIPWG